MEVNRNKNLNKVNKFCFNRYGGWLDEKENFNKEVGRNMIIKRLIYNNFNVLKQISESILWQCGMSC